MCEEFVSKNSDKFVPSHRDELVWDATCKGCLIALMTGKRTGQNFPSAFKENPDPGRCVWHRITVFGDAGQEDVYKQCRKKGVYLVGMKA